MKIRHSVYLSDEGDRAADRFDVSPQFDYIIVNAGRKVIVFIFPVPGFGVS